jgi:CheY-like chemotaxis protein
MSTDTEFMRILLVDDNRDSADLVAELLRYTGHETQTAYDGIEAINIAAWFSPQVIITDLSMPNMDGLAVTRAMRRMPNLCDAAIIILTGYWNAQSDAAKEAGVDVILLKPAKLETILSGVRSASKIRRDMARTQDSDAFFKR